MNFSYFDLPILLIFNEWTKSLKWWWWDCMFNTFQVKILQEKIFIFMLYIGISLCAIKIMKTYPFTFEIQSQKLKTIDYNANRCLLRLQLFCVERFSLFGYPNLLFQQKTGVFISLGTQSRNMIWLCAYEALGNFRKIFSLIYLRQPKINLKSVLIYFTKNDLLYVSPS